MANFETEQYNKALQLHRTGFLDQAEEIYWELVYKNPENAQVWDLLGVIQAQQNQLTDALSCFKNAHERDPDNPGYLSHLGNIHRKLKNLEEAREYLERAIACKPDYAEAWNNLGNVYFEMQLGEKALQHYQKALELKPDYTDCYYNLANCYLQLQKPEEAHHYWSLLLEKETGNLQAHYQLGNLCYENNLLDEARTHFQAVLAVEPDNVPAQLNYAATLLKENKIEEAIAEYSSVLEYDTDNSLAHKNLGAIYLTQQNTAKAISHYFSALIGAPNDFTTHFNLGVIFSETKKWESAEIHLQMAVKLNPESADASYNYANVLLKLQKKEKAAEYYKKVVELQPDNESALYILKALTGNDIPSQAPAAYIEHLFDNYAQAFDAEVLEKLQYKVPELLAQVLANELGESKDLNIVDLGCGSGLCGAYLKAYAKKLTGVDLSEKMLDVALKKGMYDELIKLDIQFFLEQNSKVFDILVASDVFVYFGDLGSLLCAGYESLKSGGILAFSVETAKIKPWILQQTGRYAHATEYVRKMAQLAGFTIKFDQSVTLRTQQGEPVAGRIYLLIK